MVRSRGYLQSLDDFRSIPLSVTGATPVLLRDVATVQIGPEMRRGIAELDGEGEVAGGVVVMRSGKNARTTIEAVKAKLETLKSSLPAGVEIVPTYDRSLLIDRAVDNLRSKLVEEFIVVALVCAIFLFHLRSALVAVVALPIGVLAAFIVMHWQGVNANIMSLGGIAIAIGAMVDGADRDGRERAQAHRGLRDAARPAAEHFASDGSSLADASVEVGPALFFSLLVITLSFVPVFSLEAQEGRLFSPLAFTKTYAMAAAAGLSVTLVPVLMGYLIRGRIPHETANPVNRFLMAVYRPALEAGACAFPRRRCVVAAFLLALTAVPLLRLGGEFMPPLDEGDLLYMPSALPGLSVSKASELLQQTDRMIKTVPEVARVFGKAGRADTATDPAPLEMFETTIQFKPREQWRAGMTPDKLVEELDQAVKVPGLSNVWVPPIRNRIDMLATGIKSPVGIKVAGADLATIDALTTQIEAAVKNVPGVSSALAERLTGGRYIDVDVDRLAAARYGLSVADVQAVVSTAIGGDNVGEVIQGRERYPINVRYPREIRDSLQRLRELPFVTAKGATAASAGRREDRHRGRPADAAKRERAPLRLGLCRRARPGSSLGRQRHAGRSGKVGQAAGRLRGVMVRSVRVPGTRHRAAEAGRASDAGRHLRPALPALPVIRRRSPGDGGRAVLAGRRLLARLGAWPLDLRRHRRRLHRAGGCRSRVRRRDARLPEECARSAHGRRRADER